jgi:cysteine desulfurase
MKVYLDNAATTALDSSVLEVMMPYLTEQYGNPSSIHGFGRETKAAIEKSRKVIAKYLNASVGEIFFTSGGTESANLVLKCAVERYSIKHIITSKIEHHCVTHPVEELEKAGKIQAHYVQLDDDGRVVYEDLERLVHQYGKDALVALMHANNEIGNLLDIERVAQLCSEQGALFFSDTVQTIAHFPLDMQKTPIHFISGSAHKFHGPKGVGFVFIRSEKQLCPLIHGGSQERNMRAGTENIYGIVGLAKAMENSYNHILEYHSYINDLKSYLYTELKNAIPDIKVNGVYGDESLYTVLNVSFPANENSDFLIYNLDINNIAASAGSACTSGSDQGSHVLRELAIDPTRANVRFSFSRHNTHEELDYVVQHMSKFYGIAQEQGSGN